MDLLPPAALHDWSDSGASSADESGEPSPPSRLALSVGQPRSLPHFTGTCLGDTVSWKGSQVTRVAVLQSGGSGRDRLLWGSHWGKSLACLGADIGVITETRIRGEVQHAKALQGLWSAGYLALSHGGADEVPRGQSVPGFASLYQLWAVGVVLAVRKDVLGSWSVVQQDCAGRGLAGNLTLANGIVLRVIGVYGPSGASLPGFDSMAERVSDERRLVSWVCSQITLCSDKGWYPLVAGDLNSVSDPSLDCWGSSHVRRPSSLAPALLDAGLVDAFRLRRPTVRAFTFYTRCGSASRLDSVFTGGPLLTQLPPINAAIVWQWERRVDHDPVIVDFLFRIPESPPPSASRTGDWKVLMARLASSEVSSLQQIVGASVQLRVSEFRDLESIWAQLAVDTSHLFLQSVEGVDSPVSRYLCPDQRSDTLQRRLDSAFAHLHTLLRMCLPTPAVSCCNRDRRVYNAWDQCVSLLTAIRTYLVGVNLEGRVRPITASKVSLSEARRLWAKAQDMARHAHAGNLSSCSAPPQNLAVINVNWDGFYTSPTGWVRQLGFSAELAHSAVASLDPLATPTLRVPEVAASDLEWPGGGVTLGNLPACLSLLSHWVSCARASLAAFLHTQSSSARSGRVSLLRTGNISQWSKKMKPPSQFKQYYPEFVADNGAVRRPTSVTDHLLGARQEWSRVVQEPSLAWSHPFVCSSADPSGSRRGSVAWDRIARSLPEDISSRVGRAYISPGPWHLLRWRASCVYVLSASTVRVGTWLYTFCGDCWYASRQGPMPGPQHILVAVNGEPAFSWTVDRWFCMSSSNAGVLHFSVVRLRESPQVDCVAPLTASEQADVLRRLCGSRPGPSGFKLGFLLLFPPWVQQLYWSALDLQRRTGLVASCLKSALQVHLPKPDGGWRPLSMLEEGFKAIEGPVTRRLNKQADPWDLSVSPFSSTNTAYQSGVSAASEVLHLDVLVCEDAFLHNRPFCRIPADYEKYFNTVQLTAIDAVQQSRGIPDCARRLYQNAFQGTRIFISTGVGVSEPVLVTRGCPQGAVSSPYLSRAAQDPVLRLREQSPAHYVTSAGRAIACVGYADDVEHYGSGLQDLPLMLLELGAGSRATGIGFCWRKFWVFASDWDTVLPRLSPEAASVIHPDGADVRSWNIWSGGELRAFLPRGREDKEERLLGKRGCLSDRHTLSADDLLLKFAAARRRLSIKQCTWDECIALYQWIVRGTVAYVPLVGIPCPLQLHEEDASFQRLLLSALGVRSTAERVSLLVASHDGGLGAPSVVESLVASCASDLVMLLSGVSTASLCARDSLRHALSLPPNAIVDWDGLVVRGMRFLSGYGFHVTVSSDRLVGRILDELEPRGGAHPMVGPFQHSVFLESQRFCRVGVLANTIRGTLASFRLASLPLGQWGDPAQWAPHIMLANVGFSAAVLARAVAAALTRAEAEWVVECSLFRPNSRPPLIPEDWPGCAWDNPWSAESDPRTSFLEEAQDPGFGSSDYGIYGDGSTLACGASSFCAQARSFGDEGLFWETGQQVTSFVAARLPRQFGSVPTTIHVAELFSLLVGLRWCKPDAWNLLVFDRSSLFSVLRAAAQGSPGDLLRLACSPLVVRIRRRVQSLLRAWIGSAPEPAWRQHQAAYPNQWHTAFPVQGKSRRMSSISFVHSGLVGVDIKSHQQGCAFPFASIVAGNEAQDQGCAKVVRSPPPCDLRYPTGGFFCFLSHKGCMITEPPRQAVRKALRVQAHEQWSKRRVQGKVASLCSQIFGPALFAGWYTECVPLAHWRSWCLPTDRRVVDLSKVLYRCIRAIGGGWTEQLHVDATLPNIAEHWRSAQALPSQRVCPLCKSGPGTPRHVVMSCLVMRPLVDMWRDALEAELGALVASSVLLERAAWWRNKLEQQGQSAGLGRVLLTDARRWPVLSAWRFAVSLPEREAFLSRDVNESSVAAVSSEMSFDMSYRAVMPMELGKALCNFSSGDSVEQSIGLGENFAVLQHPGEVAIEVEQTSRRKQRLNPAIRFTTLMLLGLRRIRIEYAKRISAWRACAEASIPVPLVPLRPPIVPTSQESLFGRWLASAAGQSCLREWRWSIPTLSVIESRLRLERCGVRVLAPSHLLDIQDSGVPVWLDGAPSWGPRMLSWDVARAALNTQCGCPPSPQPHAPLLLCVQCGLAKFGPSCARADALKCPWCPHRHGLVCRMCNRLVHFRGECAWNRGAHPAFAASAHELVLLCPDCHWSWASLLQASPRRPCVVTPSSELARHLQNLVAYAQPGAGDSVAQSKPQVTWAKTRRWILRFLQQFGPCSQEVVFRRYQAAFEGASETFLRSVFTGVLRVVCREGLLVVTQREGAPVLALQR